ncbi:MAG: hypothetical protein VKI82_02155 [Leptolyngbya sp.]|nr:hypothetical protein [Leptolyngbya sp.]
MNYLLPQSVLRWYLLRYPEPLRVMRYQQLSQWSWLQPVLEEIKPEVLPPEDLPESPDPAPGETGWLAPMGVAVWPNHYSQYRCEMGSPLNCALAERALADDPRATACPRCGFMTPLPLGAMVQGDVGNYRVGRCLGQQGISRRYQATMLGTETPVTLREYLLPDRYFNPRDQQQRRDMFLNQVGVSLADGRRQDLRVIAPIESLAPLGEARAYLVLPVEDQAVSLNHLLTQRPPFTSGEVHRVLRQVLQTLTGLHQQRYALSPGRLQTGIIHGNIQLSSLLWVNQGDEGFVYLTDFALWEDAINPLVIEAAVPSPQEDLRALGQVAFYLLTGGPTDATGQRLNPKREAHWPAVYPPLKQFIGQLLGLEDPFPQAQAAYQALLNLPPEPIISQLAPPSVVDRHRRAWWKTALVALLIFAGLGLGAYVLWQWLRPKAGAEVANPPCCFGAVGAVPEGTFVYTALAGDVWEDLLRWQPQDGLTQPWEDQLAQAQPGLDLIYRPTPSIAAALEVVQTRQAAFAIVPLLQPLPPDLAAQPIAYDGLAVVVAFSYRGRSQGLPDQLKGFLTLTQVQDLYQGQTRFWGQIRSGLSLPLELYLNPSPTTLAAIDHFIFPEDPTPDAASSPDPPSSANPIGLPPIPMLRTIINDFETAGVGSVGITPLSSIGGQCSVYPLAIGPSRRHSVQPLRNDSGQPIHPDVDLCRTKGVYQIDPAVLSQSDYPLAYPVAVVYRRDNRLPPVGPKVAELMLTEEGQTYLHQVHLSPVHPLEDR